ncbi:MAG: hypothetical protein A2X64_00055 [Ignavibacteria bacterium GWF2_33_9]|nr:MAG: hypothetical protein A2X64_00055 [Ignavibacteria bacterium GWF2_33_9]
MIDWKEYKICEIGKVITGNTPSSKFPDEFGDDMPFITPTDYKNYNKWIEKADRYLSKKGIEKLNQKILPAKSLLVTCIGSDMGKVAINLIPVITNQQINALIPSIDDPEFLYYKFIDSYDTLRSYGQAGTAVPIVNKSDFENIKILLPPLPEQNAIAEVLSSLDDKIDLLHRQNKTLEALAETLFRQWFIEEADESWEEKPLQELLEFIVDNRGMTAPTADSGIPLIATNCIKNKNIFPVYEKVRYVSKDTYDSWFRSQPEAGDIIFVNKGTPGCVNLVPDPVDFCIAQDMIALRVNEQLMSNYYLFILLRTDKFQSIIQNSSVGTTIPHLKKTDLIKFPILSPDKEYLHKFDNIVKPIFKKSNINNNQIRTLTQLRDTLLPKLMSGEIRVEV